VWIVTCGCSSACLSLPEADLTARRRRCVRDLSFDLYAKHDVLKPVVGAIIESQASSLQAVWIFAGYRSIGEHDAAGLVCSSL